MNYNPGIEFDCVSFFVNCKFKFNKFCLLLNSLKKTFSPTYNLRFEKINITDKRGILEKKSM